MSSMSMNQTQSTERRPSGSAAARNVALGCTSDTDAAELGATPSGMSHAAAAARVLIFTGGTLGEWALAEVQRGDTLIGADRGALFLVRHGLTPDLALGDFDSVSAEELAEIRAASRRFEDCDPVLKDWTDTEMAFVRALEAQPDPPQEIVLLGALGSRFDHSLANVHLLRRGLEHGVQCRILDAHNELRVVDNATPTVIRRGTFDNVSLLPLTAEVHGITLNGFQYPLTEATLTLGQSLGISNVLLEPLGHVSVKEGLLLVIQSRD